MRYRKRMSKRASRRNFSRNSGFHGMNVANPMRGGIRL